MINAFVRHEALPPVFNKLPAGSIFDRIQRLDVITFTKFQKAGRVGIAHAFNVFIERMSFKL
jgi:hypothetical protein